MDALKFLKEKGLIEEDNNRFEILFKNFFGETEKVFELVELMEEFKERILNPQSVAQYKNGDRVYLKNDSSGKRYKVMDYNPSMKKYLLRHPLDGCRTVKACDVLPCTD